MSGIDFFKRQDKPTNTHLLNYIIDYILIKTTNGRLIFNGLKKVTSYKSENALYFVFIFIVIKCISL